MRWLCWRVATLMGWSFRGEVPPLPKMVVVGAPHTSNWDFFLFLAALHAYRIEVRFLAKHTLFRPPLGFLFRAVGGIPVDRSRPGGVVGQVMEVFAATDRMILVIAPEGTRNNAPRWKTGFLEIAERAGVPVVPASIDAGTKTITIGPPLELGRDRSRLMDRLRSFYQGKTGVRPRLQGPVRLIGEGDRS